MQGHKNLPPYASINAFYFTCLRPQYKYVNLCMLWGEEGEPERGILSNRISDSSSYQHCSVTIAVFMS